MKLFKYPFTYLIGLKFYHKKNWSRAASFFQKTLKFSPNNAYATFKLGMCYFKQKQWDLAYQYIGRAIELLPEKNEWKVQFYQSQIKLSHLTTKLTTTSSAIKEALIRSQIESGQNTSQLYVALAEILGKQGKYWQEIEALKKAIDLEPNNDSLDVKLLKPLMEMKRYEEFLEIFNNLNSIKKVSGYKLWYQAGLCYQKINLEQKAEEIYKVALDLENSSDSKNFGIGYLHEKQGLWHEAVKAYLKQLKITPLNPELYQKIGFAYHKYYEWSNADKYYQLAIELMLSSKLEVNPEWYYRVAFVNERMANYEESIKFYQKALEVKYTSYWYYRLGMVFLASNLYQQAAIAFLKTKKDFKSIKLENEEYVEANKNESVSILIDSAVEAIKHDATDSKVWLGLARLYIKNNEFSNAVWAYKNAVLRTNQYNSELYYEYGLALTCLERYQEAAECLVNIQQLNKPYGVAKDKFHSNEGFRKSAIYNEYYDTLKIEENVILFESFMGISMSCNPFAIFLNMHKNPLYSNYLFVWVINDINKVDNKFKKYKNIIFIQKDSDAYLRYLCSAKFLINNSTFPPYFIRKPEQLYLNTWHGTPWKTLGKDIRNSFMELKNTERNFLQSTHILSPNQHTSWVLLNRYDIKEIYSGKLLEAGYPRIDLTLNATSNQKNTLREQLGIDVRRKTILYAPTWRGTLGSPEVETQKLIHEINQLSKLDINLLFRGHYFVENQAYDLGMERFIVPEYINTNELLSIVDVLITDYSSIGFDYMVTGNPIIYYIDDYSSYKEDRGLYFEAETLPGQLAKNVDELLQAVDMAISSGTVHPLYKEAQQKFVPYEDGLVTQRIIDWFILNHTQPNEVLQKHDKKSLLFFGGEFLPNGITTSLINLLSNIDKDKFIVSLLIDPDAIARDEKRLQQFARLPSDIHIIPRVGRMNRSIEDDWIEYKVNQYRFIPESMKPYFEKAYNREFHRMVGDTQFDAVIEFTGYSKFWAYLLGSANLSNTVKSIYQHNDLYGELRLKHPSLENTFNTYYLFDKIISVSKPTMELNKDNLVPLFHLDVNKFDYCDNVQNPSLVLEKACAEIPKEDAHLFIRKNKEKVFINLARLSPEKGQEKLIHSFKKLVNTYPDSRLLILGDGPLKYELSSLIKELSLQNNVFLLGNRLNPFSFLKAADCFVLSSNHEGQPMTLFEAMILEKPIIATDIVGSRSALEGRSGHLVENTEEGLFEGMRDFIEGKLSFDKFNYEIYQRQSLEMFYNKILN